MDGSYNMGPDSDKGEWLDKSDYKRMIVAIIFVGSLLLMAYAVIHAPDHFVYRKRAKPFVVKAEECVRKAARYSGFEANGRGVRMQEYGMTKMMMLSAEKYIKKAKAELREPDYSWKRIRNLEIKMFMIAEWVADHHWDLDRGEWWDERAKDYSYGIDPDPKNKK